MNDEELPLSQGEQAQGGSGPALARPARVAEYDHALSAEAAEVARGRMIVFDLLATLLWTLMDLCVHNDLKRFATASGVLSCLCMAGSAHMARAMESWVMFLGSISGLFWLMANMSQDWVVAGHPKAMANIFFGASLIFLTAALSHGSGSMEGVVGRLRKGNPSAGRQAPSSIAV